MKNFVGSIEKKVHALKALMSKYYAGMFEFIFNQTYSKQGDDSFAGHSLDQSYNFETDKDDAHDQGMLRLLRAMNRTRGKSHNP